MLSPFIRPIPEIFFISFFFLIGLMVRAFHASNQSSILIEIASRAPKYVHATNYIIAAILRKL